MSASVSPLPAYISEHRLPKGGPDRARFCVWYSQALDAGKEPEAAWNEAFGLCRLMHYYASAGIVEKLGPTVGGIPVSFLGEE